MVTERFCNRCFKSFGSAEKKLNEMHEWCSAEIEILKKVKEELIVLSYQLKDKAKAKLEKVKIEEVSNFWMARESIFKVLKSIKSSLKGLSKTIANRVLEILRLPSLEISAFT